MRKQTNTLSPSPKGFQSPKFSDSDSDVRKALIFSLVSQFSPFPSFLFLVSKETSGRGNQLIDLMSAGKHYKED
jgi:hypothetical protein